MKKKERKPTIARLAEDYVQKYFEKKKIKLKRVSKGELGYDFRDLKSNLFVEVKGATEKNLSKILFRYFRNTEYEKARACRKAKQKYDIHLVIGMKSISPKHYIIPSDILLENGKPEIQWTLPIRKDFERYRVKD